MEPFLLNHQLHFGAVISQFRIDTTLTADFCYLTKSTGNWWLVLVEVERPDIPLFRNNKLQLTPTAEFSERFAQIQAWRDAAAARPSPRLSLPNSVSSSASVASALAISSFTCSPMASSCSSILA